LPWGVWGSRPTCPVDLSVTSSPTRDTLIQPGPVLPPNQQPLPGLHKSHCNVRMNPNSAADIFTQRGLIPILWGILSHAGANTVLQCSLVCRQTLAVIDAADRAAWHPDTLDEVYRRRPMLSWDDALNAQNHVTIHGFPASLRCRTFSVHDIFKKDIDSLSTVEWFSAPYWPGMPVVDTEDDFSPAAGSAADFLEELLSLKPDLGCLIQQLNPASVSVCRAVYLDGVERMLGWDGVDWQGTSCRESWRVWLEGLSNKRNRTEWEEMWCSAVLSKDKDDMFHFNREGGCAALGVS
jgi:hypothetical protein